MTSRLAIAFACAWTSALAWAIPLELQAQTVVSAHELTSSLKIVSQSQSGGVQKGSFNQKDLFKLCSGNAPTKTQGVFLFLDCADVSTGPVLAAIETSPLTGLATVGTVTLDGAHAVTTSKGGDLKTEAIPALIHVDCNGVVADLNGILNLKFSPLSGGTGTCANTGTLKVTGSGSSSDPNVPAAFIVNDGSSIKANKRNGAITTTTNTVSGASLV